MGAASGGNCGAGAIAGIVGEITGDALRPSVDNRSIDRQTAIQIAGVSGGAAALLTSAATNQSDEDTANNIFAGQRIGGNAAENNSLYFMDKKIFNYPKNKDYDLNVGFQYSVGPVSISKGRDGIGATGNTVPSLSISVYTNLFPRGETAITGANIGYKNLLTIDSILTNKGNFGFGFTGGISIAPPIPFNSSINLYP